MYMLCLLLKSLGSEGADLVFSSCSIKPHKIKILMNMIISVSSKDFLALLLLLQAHVFSSRTGGCAAFLANYHINGSATVRFRNKRYDLPPWSISILPDCKNVAFNTALVSTTDAALAI